MAKKSSTTKSRHESSRTVTITTPSPFGSHTSMVKKDLGDGKVLCEDEHGLYETYRNRLDSGLADPCRYSGRDIQYELDEVAEEVTEEAPAP